MSANSHKRTLECGLPVPAYSAIIRLDLRLTIVMS
jgi:hypothetical protein